MTNATAVKTETQKISFGALRRLEEKVAILSKRIAKKGLQGFVALQVGPAIEKEEGELEFEVSLSSSLVALSGGHSLVGVVEFLGQETALLNAVPGEEIPEAFRVQGTCEACRTARDRKTLIVVRDQGGKLLRIGSSCVRDYLGCDPQDLLLYCQLVRDMEGVEEEYQAKGIWAKGLRSLVADAWAVIRAYGWVSSSNPGEAWPTAHTFKSLLAGGKTAETILQDIAPFQSASAEQASLILDWLSAQENTSAYMGNLLALLQVGFAEWKHLGLVASIPQAYSRAMDAKATAEAKALEQQQNPSKHLGEVGQKLILEGLVIGVRHIEGHYGVSTLVSIQAGSDIVKTFASGNFGSVEQGSRIKFSGTIKSHGEYKGIPETNLTRCKLLAVLEVAPKSAATLEREAVEAEIEQLRQEYEGLYDAKCLANDAYRLAWKTLGATSEEGEQAWDRYVVAQEACEQVNRQITMLRSRLKF